MYDEILDYLIDLRKDISLINNEQSLNEIVKKYDMTLSGKDFNVVNSVELMHSLNDVFNINISLEELNLILPKLSDTLSFKYEPLKIISNDNDTTTNHFQLYL